jgi:predicted nucleotidyltransferase
MNVSDFLEAFKCWVSTQTEMKAVALVGSHARDAATEGSDVDLLILTTRMDKYIRERSWVSLFGEAAECRIEDWGKVMSLRVFYRESLEVEYGFSTTDWASAPLDAGSFRVVRDGIKILFDPHHILSAVQREVLSRSEPM